MHRVILISLNVHHIHSSKKDQPIVIDHNRLAFFIFYIIKILQQLDD
jgi:hypothetical protein